MHSGRARSWPTKDSDSMAALMRSSVERQVDLRGHVLPACDVAPRQLAHRVGAEPGGFEAAPAQLGLRVGVGHHALEVVGDKGQGRQLITTENTVEIEGGDKPALIANTLVMAMAS